MRSRVGPAAFEHAVGDFGLAEHDEIGAEFLEMLHRRARMGTSQDIEFGIDGAGLLDDLARLEGLRIVT
jgi:hypothetical protein